MVTPNPDEVPYYRVMAHIAARGHIDMLQSFQSLDSSEVHEASRPTDWFNEGPWWSRMGRALIGAASNGQLEAVKWLHRNTSVCSSKEIIDSAAGRGHLDVVKWLHDNRSDGCTTYAMDCAASNGHLGVVQWLHQNRSEGCTSRAIDFAAAKGHFAVVKWLWENRSEGCTATAIANAVSQGHLCIAYWLRLRFPHLVPVDVNYVVNAADEFEMLIFLRDHYPHYYTAEFFRFFQKEFHRSGDTRSGLAMTQIAG